MSPNHAHYSTTNRTSGDAVSSVEPSHYVQEGDTMDVLELLAEQGLSISFDGGRTIPDVLIRAYSALNEGTGTVLMFGSEASEDELSAFLTDETDANGSVLHSSELDTLTLKRKVDYYGNRAKIKRGPVSVSQPIKREDGTPYAFAVRKSAVQN